MDARQPPHILVVAYPIQSHINPALQFATRLTRSGVLVTLATTVSAANRIIRAGDTSPAGLSFAAFSDGYDNVFKPSKDNKSADALSYMASLKLLGSETLSELITTATPPYSGVVYTIILTWVPEVARRHRLPSALLWIQNATLFSICYHYFNRYYPIIDKCNENDPEWRVELPSLPPLRARDIPSFLLPSTPVVVIRELLKEQFEIFQRDEKRRSIVLVNTFNELEHEIVESFTGNAKIEILTVGPLSPTRASVFKIDMFKRSEADYVAWLDAKPTASVVYVSFGSVSELSRAQMEELAGALVASKMSFLWVIRAEEDEEKFPMWEEVEKRGMVVPWCSQVEVLAHGAVGCFVTHCGWNSTVESLVAGVPVVAFPLGSDQLTNAKMVEEVWRTGVRVGGGVGEGRVVEREEIRRRVEEVMGREELRRNARRWRELAAEAAGEGGSTVTNIGAFVEEAWRWETAKAIGKCSGGL